MLELRTRQGALVESGMHSVGLVDDEPYFGGSR
jgi:hypothetical protein